MTITLDSRLKEDTYLLGRLSEKTSGGNNDCLLLLSKNAAFPWFILVPSTQEIEFHKLQPGQQAGIQQHINSIAQFIEQHFPTDKINIASIGNIVSQLHIHIIGRRKDDACWPGVVWGSSHSKKYEAHEVVAIKSQLADACTFFVANNEKLTG